jgi:hypothetical protein
LTGVVVRVKCAVGDEKVNTGGRCGAIVLFLAVSETSAIKHLTTENNPKDYTRHSKCGKNLKSKHITTCFHMME